MVMTRMSFIRALPAVLLLTALVLAGVGCHAQPAQWSNLGDQSQEEDQATSQDRHVNTKGLHVVAVPGRYVTQLRASDVVRILKTVGCSSDQIMEIGADLHDALAQKGVADIMMGRRAEARIQVGNNQILISSVSRGMYIYDLRKGQIGLPNMMPGQPATAAQSGLRPGN